MCYEKLVRLDDEPNIKEISHVIRNKIDSIEQSSNLFVAYNKIKIKPSKKQKTKLRIMNYFIEINIYFKKATIKSKNVYCIHTNVDKAKILNI